MSRSIHQTLRQVFREKSKEEIVEMCDPFNPDIDFVELLKKRKIKKDTIKQRKKYHNNKTFSPDEFINYLSLGGECTFKYDFKNYSITKQDAKYFIVEQSDDGIIKDFDNTQELFSFLRILLKLE